MKHIQATIVKTLLLGLLLSQGLMAAPMKRVLLAPAPPRASEKDLRDPAFAAQVVVQLYLWDWLTVQPGVQLVDETQARSLIGHVTNQALILDENARFAQLNELLPLNAAITAIHSDSGATCRIYTPGGTQDLEIAPTAMEADLRKTIQTIANALALPTDTLTLPPVPLDQPALLTNLYTTRLLWADWINNSGEARLERLRPYLNVMPGSPYIAAELMDAATWLSRDKRAVKDATNMSRLAQLAVLSLLGTDHEDRARTFCRETRYGRELVESSLLAIVDQAGRDALDTILDDAPEADALQPSADPMAKLLGGPRTTAQQAGAIRCLGALGSTAALPHLKRLATSPEPALRAAVAHALGQLKSPAYTELLQTLTKDNELEVAFTAASQGDTAAAVPLARRYLGQHADSAEALRILSIAGQATDAPLLAAHLQDASATHRELAIDGLLRLKAATPDQLRSALQDPASSVISAALNSLPQDQLESYRASLITLANHPATAIAEAARTALQPLMPTDPVARERVELEAEHPYVRRQLVLAWQKRLDDTAKAGLQAAAANSVPQIRQLAIKALATALPQFADTQLKSWLADPHRLVRLPAAQAATRVATDPAILEQALPQQVDEATRLYLLDAIARLKHQPLPQPRPPVHRVSATENQTFSCGWTAEVDHSAFDGFYGLGSPQPEEMAAVRHAHEAGKIFLIRANETAKNPGQVLLSPYWQDGYWLGLDAQFGDHWDIVDGIVLGEESMYFRPYQLWDTGWRLFCREAHLDPKRIAGDREQLTGPEKAAWWDWEQRLAIEGFNTIVDTVKLRYGKLRPGIQIATFMPDQNGPCPYDAQWNFDIAAGYYYAAPTRLRYASIRRMKTVWPDRPVLWLNQGKAGVHLPLNKTQLQYSTKIPDSPLHELNHITAADSTATWLAGGHTGLFAIYLFVHVKWKGEDFGRWVSLEDLTPTSTVFQTALAHSFQGLAEKYRLDAEVSQAKPSGAAKATDEFSLEDPADVVDPYEERAKQKKAAFRLGMLMERKLILDSVNLLAGLPFPEQSHRVLLIGPRAMRAPGFDLANSFDCLQQLNAIPRLELSSYRFIGLTNQETTPLTDTTITTIQSWLQQHPGLLYIHGWVNGDAEASTTTDLDGKLTQPWPWQNDLTPITETQTQRRREHQVTTAYTITGTRTTILREHEGKPTLVLWQAAGSKGAVLFDAGDTPTYELRQIINSRIDLFLGPAGMTIAHTPAYEVAATGPTAGNATLQLQGVDALTGLLNPTLANQRSAAFIAHEVRGRYLIAAHGITILAETPPTDVKTTGATIQITGGGLLQIVSASKLQITPSLPMQPADQLLAWMLNAEKPGQITLKRPEGATLTYLRSPTPLTLSTQKN